MTGEIENGRSMSVIRNALPLNSNFAIAQAAITPKTRLSGTEMAATSSVRRMAESASGSTIASQKLSAPLRKASKKTETSGRTRKAARKTKAIAINASRAGSSLAGSRNGRGRAGSGLRHNRTSCGSRPE